MKNKIAILMMFSLFGCANHTTENGLSDSQNDILMINNHVYGKLEKVNGKYSFTRFSESYVANEPWVRIYDFYPMWSKEQENCLTGVVELTNKSATCSTDNENLFREKGTDFTVKKTAGYLFLSALSFGLWAAMPPGAVKFDEDAYNSAIKEASSGFGKNYRNSIKDFNSNKIKYNREIDIIETTYNARSYPDITIVDGSGVLNKEKYDFKNVANVYKNNLLSDTSSRSISTDTLDEFFSLSKVANNLKLKEAAKNSSELNIECRRNIYANVDYVVECPKTISAKQQKFYVKVFIKSVTLQNAMPETIVAEDEYVRVVLKNGNVHVSNKTSSYVSFDSFSFYYNQKISTKSALNSEMAPLSESYLVSIDSLRIDGDQLKFSDVTKVIADRTNIRYGMAIKYRIIDKNKEKTLIKMKDYSLRELI